jgi:MFS family permease
VAVMGFGGALARRFSHPRILLASLPLLGLTLVLMLTGKSPSMLFVIMFIHGLLIGVTDVIMNAEGSAIEHDLKRPVFTAFHACLSASLAASAIASSYLTTMSGPFSAACPALVMVAAACISVWKNVPARLLPGQTRAAPLRVASLPLVLMGIAAGFAMACETSAMFWSAKMLDETAPRLAAISGLGAAFFGLCNAAVRFPGDALRSRFGDIGLMLLSVCVAIAGFLGLGFSPSFGFSVGAFALVGFGTAIICPCIFNMATAQVPGNRAAGMGFASLVAGVPRVAAPFLFGWISGTWSISTAFGLCAVLMAAALLLILRLSRHRSTPGMAVP